MLLVNGLRLEQLTEYLTTIKHQWQPQSKKTRGVPPGATRGVPVGSTVRPRRFVREFFLVMGSPGVASGGLPEVSLWAFFWASWFKVFVACFINVHSIASSGNLK